MVLNVIRDAFKRDPSPEEIIEHVPTQEFDSPVWESFEGRTIEEAVVHGDEDDDERPLSYRLVFEDGSRINIIAQDAAVSVLANPETTRLEEE